MSEAVIQDRIRDKLERKYGVRNVKVCAGPAEHGVDIVFARPGDFGEKIIIGIQLKVEPKMGTSIAQKAVGQAVIALGHEFIVDDQHPKRLDLVYILNYGTYQPTTLEYLKNAKNAFPSLIYHIDKTWLDAFLADSIDFEAAIMEAE